MAITLRQSASAGTSGGGTGGSLTLPAPALAGSLLTMVLGHRNSVYSSATIAGWARTGYTHTAPGTLDADSVSVWWKVATGGEQVVALPLFNAQHPASGVIAEFVGLPGFASGDNAVGADASGAVFTLPAIDGPDPGAPAVLVRAAWKKLALPNPGPSTLAGWSLLGDSGYAGTGNRMRLTAWYLVAPAMAESYAALARSSSGDAGDAGVVITGLAYGEAGRSFAGEPGGGVW